MFEAYSVGVTLRLNNLVSAQLLALSGEVIKLDGLVIGLNKTLKAVATDTPAFKALAQGINQSSRAMERASVSAAAFQRHLAAAIATAQAAGGMPVLPMPGRGGGGGGGGGGGHGRPFGGYAHGGNIHFGPGGIGLGTVGVSAGPAFLPLAAGAASIYGAHAAYEAAKDLDTERTRFRLYGLSAAQNNEAFRFVDNMRIFGSTRAENMRNFREAQGVFRESGLGDAEALHGAMMAAPIMAKLASVQAAMSDEGRARSRHSMLSAIRYAEMSGGTKSAEDFYRIVNFGYKLSESSGGQIDFERLRQFKARAGSAGFGLTDDALARLEPIMGEMTGSTAGVALRTAYNRIGGLIKLPNQVAHMLVDSGIWDGSKVQFNSMGGIKRIDGNPLGAANTKLFAENPELFYEQVIRPIYEKMKLSSTEITRQNAMLFGSTGGALFNLIERQLPTIQKSVKALEKAAGINESYAMARESLSGQEREFVGAWTDFKATAGMTMLPFFTGLLKGGAAFLRGAHDEGGQTTGFWSGIGRVLSGQSSLSVWRSMSGAGSGVDTVAPAPTAGKAAMTGTVMLDGRKVGTFMADHLGRLGGLPQTGPSFFDSTLAPIPAGGLR